MRPSQRCHGPGPGLRLQWGEQQAGWWRGAKALDREREREREREGKDQRIPPRATRTSEGEQLRTDRKWTLERGSREKKKKEERGWDWSCAAAGGGLSPLNCWRRHDKSGRLDGYYGSIKCLCWWPGAVCWYLKVLLCAERTAGVRSRGWTRLKNFISGGAAASRHPRQPCLCCSAFLLCVCLI